jgi:hypothetical protein
MTARGLLAAALAALALLLVACGGDDEEPSATGAGEAAEEAEGGGEEAEETAAPAEVDSCELLTEADVKDILGENVKGKSTSKADPSTGTPDTCLWELRGELDLSADNDDAFSVLVSAGDEAYFDSNELLVGEDESYEGLDLGDDAYAGDTRGAVLIGGTSLVVQLGIAAEPESHEAVLDALDRVIANYEAG